MYIQCNIFINMRRNRSLIRILVKGRIQTDRLDPQHWQYFIIFTFFFQVQSAQGEADRCGGHGDLPGEDGQQARQYKHSPTIPHFGNLSKILCFITTVTTITTGNDPSLVQDTPDYTFTGDSLLGDSKRIPVHLCNTVLYTLGRK